MKPVNLEALTKWVGKLPTDIVEDLARIAPMLARLGYDPFANPPKYGNPDALVVNNTHRVLKGDFKTPSSLKGFVQIHQNNSSHWWQQQRRVWSWTSHQQDKMKKNPDIEGILISKHIACQILPNCDCLERMYLHLFVRYDLSNLLVKIDLCSSSDITVILGSFICYWIWSQCFIMSHKRLFFCHIKHQTPYWLRTGSGFIVYWSNEKRHPLSHGNIRFYSIT